MQHLAQFAAVHIVWCDLHDLILDGDCRKVEMVPAAALN